MASGVVVANTPRRNAQAVAELTLALMLNLLRPVIEAAAFVATGAWTDPIAGYLDFAAPSWARRPSASLAWAPLVGARPRCYSRLDAGFWRVIPRSRRLKCRRSDAPPRRSMSCSPASTMIAVHCPALPATESLINAAALAKMPAGARLVATTGESVVDTAAVAAALTDGRLAGAAFDVFETHPVPPGHPLLAAPNVILLPHIGGATDVTVTRHSEMIVDDYLRF